MDEFLCILLLGYCLQVLQGWECDYIVGVEAVSDELGDQSIPPASYDLSRPLLLVLEEQYLQ